MGKDGTWQQRLEAELVWIMTKDVQEAGWLEKGGEHGCDHRKACKGT